MSWGGPWPIQPPPGRDPGRMAGEAVRNAIERGVLPRPTDMACVVCGGGATQFHHWSYEKLHRLDVVAVCRPCHVRIHQGEVPDPMTGGRWKRGKGLTPSPAPAVSP